MVNSWRQQQQIVIPWLASSNSPPVFTLQGRELLSTTARSLKHTRTHTHKTTSKPSVWVSWILTSESFSEVLKASSNPLPIPWTQDSRQKPKQAAIKKPQNRKHLWTLYQCSKTVPHVQAFHLPWAFLQTTPPRFVRGKAHLLRPWQGEPNFLEICF